MDKETPNPFTPAIATHQMMIVGWKEIDVESKNARYRVNLQGRAAGERGETWGII